MMQALNRDLVDIVRKFVLDDVYRQLKHEYMHRFVYGSAWDRFHELERLNPNIDFRVLQKRAHKSVPREFHGKIVSLWCKYRHYFKLVNSNGSAINWRHVEKRLYRNCNEKIYTFNSKDIPENDFDFETNSVAVLPRSYFHYEIQGLTGKVIN